MLRELVRTYGPGDLGLAKSLLDAEDIPYYAHGEAFASMRPFLEPVRILIDEEDFDRAFDLLEPLGLDLASQTDASER